MKLTDLLEELEKAQCYIAVVDEVLILLRKAEEGDLSIPVDVGDGTVPPEYVTDIIDVLEQFRDHYTEVLEEADELEVAGGRQVDTLSLV